MAALTIDNANRIANDHLRAGRLREANALFQQVLQHAPAHPVALHGAGLVAHHTGRHEHAIELIRRAIAADPASAEYHYNLSSPLRVMGRLDEAATELRAAISLRPAFPEALSNLGTILVAQGCILEARSAFQEALGVAPRHFGAYINLGKVARMQDRLDEAESFFRQATEISPNSALAFSMLGSCLREAGKISEAIAAFRRAIELKPDYREAHSNLVYALHFDPQVSPESNFHEHLRWAERHAEPLRASVVPHSNDPTPDRRLRIGYVSPNLQNHVIGFFMQPILERHDGANFEVYCYADSQSTDPLAQRLQANADVWRNTTKLNDAQLADLIRQDRIDILIDLTLHMKGSRLLTFARKPAPVQITHLAYCATSGSQTMDWCVADPHLAPEGTERYFTERLLRLPESYWCYRPADACPEVSPLPAARNGYVTFGSLNTFAKVNPAVISLWAKLLQVMPNARLALHVPGGPDNHSARDRLAQFGIPLDRLQMLGRRPPAEYLAQYGQIDLALDPFPYCGGTTTLDALWMGVPVVTLVGKVPLARAGVTLLTNLGLPEFIARTPEDYIEIAADWARDRDRLATLRGSLRERLHASPLMNEPRYVRHLEDAYRAVWRTWCSQVQGKQSV